MRRDGSARELRRRTAAVPEGGSTAEEADSDCKPRAAPAAAAPERTGSGRRVCSPIHSQHISSHLFDVDWLKQQTILNARPKHRAKAARKAALRMLLLPVNAGYWCGSSLSSEFVMSKRLFCSLAGLYIVQLVALFVYASHSNAKIWQAVEPLEVMAPLLYHGLLSLLWGRTASGAYGDEVKGGSGNGTSTNDEDGDREESEDDEYEEEGLLPFSRTATAPMDERRRQIASPISPSSPPQRPLPRVPRSACSDGSEMLPPKQFPLSSLSGPLSSLTAGTDTDAGDDIFDEASDEGDRLTVTQYVRVKTRVRSPCRATGSLSPPHGALYPSMGKFQAHKRQMRVIDVRECILREVEKRQMKKPKSTFPELCAAAVATVPLLHRLAIYWQYERSLIRGLVSLPAMDAVHRLPGVVMAMLWFPHHPLQGISPENETVCLMEAEHPMHNEVAMVLLVSLTSALATLLTSGALFRAMDRAEQVYSKRYLYAKFFSALTSSGKSQRHGLPHFRLKSVENIRAWLSLRGSRAWLRHNPDELAADAIVSTCFQLVLLLFAVMGVTMLGTAGSRTKGSVGLHSFFALHHLVIFTFTMLLSYYLLHFMMIGSSINQRYANACVLLTEQLNVHLRIIKLTERECGGEKTAKLKEKRERLLNTLKVLDVATKLLKELEGPNKISGLSMNPLLYNITRVLVLSCFSAAMSSVFGFSPKLWKL